MKIKAGTLKMEQPREGPYNIPCVHTSGTVTIQKGPIKERLNVQQIIPYTGQKIKIKLTDKSIIQLIREESAVHSKNALKRPSMTDRRCSLTIVMGKTNRMYRLDHGWDLMLSTVSRSLSKQEAINNQSYLTRILNILEHD
jgi:hypothetical protein